MRQRTCQTHNFAELYTEHFAGTDEKIIRAARDYLDFKSWLEEKRARYGSRTT